MKTHKLIIIGHRGAKGLAPENTLAAFDKALEYHVDVIELDVRVTSDGKAVLAHDPFTTDPSGAKLDVKSSTYAELKTHKPDLCDLESAIRHINHAVPINVEIKPGVPTEEPVRILKQLLAEGWQPQDFRLGSFSWPVIRAAHQALPELPTIVIEAWSGVRATWRARRLKTKDIAMLEYWLWPGFIRALARQGYELYAAPPNSPVRERRLQRFGLTGRANNPQKIQRWAQAGLAGVITDFPDRFEN